MNATARRFVFVALLLALPAVNASAQAWEISPFARYVTNAEFDFASSLYPGTQLLAKDSWAFGAGIGYAPNSQFMFEGEYAYQSTDLVLQQQLVADQDLSGMTIQKIRGNFLFSPPYSGAPAQPYFLIGLGAAIFDVDLASASSKTKFSWQLGAGVKKMMSDTMGLRLQAAYAPSYLSEDNDTWCDPFYGCYSYPDPQYLDQWEFSLGLVKRFGSTYR